MSRFYLPEIRFESKRMNTLCSTSIKSYLISGDKILYALGSSGFVAFLREPRFLMPRSGFLSGVLDVGFGYDLNNPS